MSSERVAKTPASAVNWSGSALNTVSASCLSSSALRRVGQALGRERRVRPAVEVDGQLVEGGREVEGGLDRRLLLEARRGLRRVLVGRERADLGIGRRQLREVVAHQGRRRVRARAGRRRRRRDRRGQGPQLGGENALLADAPDDVLGVRDPAGDGAQLRPGGDVREREREPVDVGQRGVEPVGHLRVEQRCRNRSQSRRRCRRTCRCRSSPAASTAGSRPAPRRRRRASRGWSTVATPVVARSVAMRSRSRASEAGASMSPPPPASTRPVDWTSLSSPRCAAMAS